MGYTWMSDLFPFLIGKVLMSGKNALIIGFNVHDVSIPYR